MENNKQIIARLENGDKLRFPEGTSQEVVDKAVQQHIIGQNASQIKAPLDLPWYEDALNWTKKNMELPMGMGGSLGGAVVGTLLGGPIGTVVGGVAGGALGSAGGSITSDIIEKDVENIDYWEALEEAGLSLGIDVLTLGAGSKIKAMLQAKKALGISPEKAAEQLLKNAKEGLAVGSPESLQATQRLLQEGGATLTPSQTRQASGLQSFSESIGQLGVFSGNILSDNATKVNDVIEQNLTQIVQRNSTGALDSVALGEELNGVLSAGKQAMIVTYGVGLDEIKRDVSSNVVNTGFLKAPLAAFRKNFISETVDSLDPKVAEYVKNLMDITLKPANLKAGTILDLDKLLTKELSNFEAGVSTGIYTNSAARELKLLQTALREGIDKGLRNVNPTAADKYFNLKKAYSQNMNGLLPEINSTMLNGIANGKRGYETLGRLLTTARDPEKIQAFMKSIDTAYLQMPSEEAAKLTFKTASEAKEAIKSSFLEKTFNLAGEGSPDFKGYIDEAARWGSKDGQRILRTVFGNDAPRVKQLVNMMAETATKPDSNYFGLALRGREVGTFAQTAGSAASLAGMDLLTGGLSTAAILGTPIVLAKAATNPKTVNMLLAFEKKKFKSEDARNSAAGVILNQIVQPLSSSSLQELQDKIFITEKQQQK